MILVISPSVVLGQTSGMKKMESVLPLLYGPVQSRRHGLSLGINLGDENQKSCSWGCLYCQCGFGKISDQFVSSRSPDEIITEVKEKLALFPDLQAITFAGNSEPGLYSKLFELIKKLKLLRYGSRAKWKIQIFSNGSELSNESVKQAFLAADECWIKLDLASDELFKKVNHPVRGDLHSHLEHLKSMQPLRIQSMVWKCSSKPELSNSSLKQLEALFKLYQELKPVAVHLYTIAREPAFHDLEPVDAEALQWIERRLKELNVPANVFMD